MFAIRDCVGDQAFLAAIVLFGEDHGLFHFRMLRQQRFDLSQFDAESADLYLVVAASQELDVASSGIAGQVSGAIHLRLRIVDERIVQEAFGRALWLVQVSRGDARSGNVEFANYTHRHWFEMVIENVDLGVGDGTPDGNARE